MSSVVSQGHMMFLSQVHAIPGRDTQQGEEHGGRPRRADGTEGVLDREVKKASIQRQDCSLPCRGLETDPGLLVVDLFLTSMKWGKDLWGDSDIWDIYEGLASCRLIGLGRPHQNFREHQTGPDPDAII